MAAGADLREKTVRTGRGPLGPASASWLPHEIHETPPTSLTGGKSSSDSRNSAGRHTDSWETILNYISTTTTRTGLQVRSVRARQQYQTGAKITKQQMAGLKLVQNENLPQWNYDIHLRETDSESELPSPCLRSELLPACLRQGSTPSPGGSPKLAHQPKFASQNGHYRPIASFSPAENGSCS